MAAIELAQAYANIDDFIDGGNGIHQALLDAAAGWVLSDEVSAVAGAQDRVYYSPGSDDHKALWLRITNDSANERLLFRAYSFWQPPAAPLTRAGYHEVGDALGATCLQLVDGPMTGWIAADADGVACVADVGGAVYNKGYFGALQLTVPPQRSFFGLLAGPATGTNQEGTSTLLFQAGTSFSQLQAGQYLWVVNQSSTSGPGNVELVQVDSFDVGDRTITTVAPLENDYDIDAAVSIDPQPMVLWGDDDGDLVGATPYALHDGDSYGGGLTHDLTRASIVEATEEAALPISSGGHIFVADCLFYSTAPDPVDVRGTLTRFRRVPPGSVVSLDDVTVNTSVHRVFADDTGFFAFKED